MNYDIVLYVLLRLPACSRKKIYITMTVTVQRYEPCNGRGVPGGRHVPEDMVGECERAAVESEIEEGDEVAVHGKALGGRRVMSPGAAVQVEGRVEQPRRDLPFHGAPLVEQLRHLRNVPRDPSDL